MSFEIQGIIVQIGETQQVSDKFRKREFVLEITEEINGNSYTNYAKMQTVQNKCDILDKYSEEDTVTAYFNVKGNKWEKDGKVNYITNLDVWRIDAVQNTQPVQGNTTVNTNPSPENGDDMPF